MSLAKEKKQQVISEFTRKPQDTGSAEVQVALMTARIQSLVEHLKIHKKDVHSKKGLLTLISSRKKMLKYLKNNDYDRYRELIKKLGIRK
ncbi:MAG TPA: 30S ribosomal protein S15 [Spirochaetia bacterium]|nr:MAG: 30S ribosomal protein S15 [Spirochaetes bacterium GWB1_36_13]HCL56083.1 30S ribosomal protein S15 [Spirochaetia bacterium]